MRYSRVLKISLVALTISASTYLNIFAASINFGNDVFYQSKKINLFVNSEKINNMQTNPVFYNDSLLVPIREVFEPLGAYVEYKELERKVYIIYNDKLICLRVNNVNATIDQKKITLSIPPKIVNNKLLIPLRTVAENLDLQITWDPLTNSAFVYEKNYINNSNKEKQPDSTGGNKQSNWVLENSNSTIKDETYANIVNLSMQNSNEKNTFVITSYKQIESYERVPIDGNKLVIDFFNTYHVLSKNSFEVNNEYIDKIRLGVEIEKEKYKTRLVFDLRTAKDASIVFSNDKKHVYIQFENKSNANLVNNSVPTTSNVQTSSKNVSYDKFKSRITIKKNTKSNTLNNIVKFDDYNNNKFTYLFQSDLGIGATKITVNDTKMSNFEFSNIGGKTQLVINEKVILAPVISEDLDNIYIDLKLPKEVF